VVLDAIGWIGTFLGAETTGISTMATSSQFSSGNLIIHTMGFGLSGRATSPMETGFVGTTTMDGIPDDPQ
jgi:hypothetical protein